MTTARQQGEGYHGDNRRLFCLGCQQHMQLHVNSWIWSKRGTVYLTIVWYIVYSIVIQRQELERERGGEREREREREKEQAHNTESSKPHSCRWNWICLVLHTLHLYANGSSTALWNGWLDIWLFYERTLSFQTFSSFKSKFYPDFTLIELHISTSSALSTQAAPPLCDWWYGPVLTVVLVSFAPTFNHPSLCERVFTLSL